MDHLTLTQQIYGQLLAAYVAAGNDLNESIMQAFAREARTAVSVFLATPA